MSKVPPTLKPTAVEGPPTLKPTAASDWKREATEPELVILPSGNTALLKRPSMLAMMKQGEIPNPLMEAAVDLLDGQAPKDFGGLVELLEHIAIEAFVEPRISRNGSPQDGEIALSDLSDADKLFVSGWMRGVADEAAPFRTDGPGASAGGDGGEVRDEAERDARHP
jgi:hypothetical protein